MTMTTTTMCVSTCLWSFAAFHYPRRLGGVTRIFPSSPRVASTCFLLGQSIFRLRASAANDAVQRNETKSMALYDWSWCHRFFVLVVLAAVTKNHIGGAASLASCWRNAAAGACKTAAAAQRLLPPLLLSQSQESFFILLLLRWRFVCRGDDAGRLHSVVASSSSSLSSSSIGGAKSGPHPPTTPLKRKDFKKSKRTPCLFVVSDVVMAQR
jgi:hypothetical protein